MRAALASRMTAVVLREGAEAPEVDTLPTPAPRPGEALVRTLATGIDGTDEEVVAGGAGDTPGGGLPMILGHEALGEIVEAPAGSGLRRGDLVVPLVRHGCGACPACNVGEADHCITGNYQEHGIKGLPGFMREYWTDDPAALVKVPKDLGELAVLTEPLSIVVKALEEARHVRRRLGWIDPERPFHGARALIAGTGSLGALGSFLLRHEGMEVWALDRHGDDTAAARLLGEIGVRHLNSRERSPGDLAREVGAFDLVVEATGAPEVLFSCLEALAPNGVMTLLGVPRDKPPIPVEGDEVMRRMVLGNQVLLGSVNSNRRHVEAATAALLGFRDRWGASPVERLVTHRYAPEDAAEAFAAAGEDVVKKVMVWGHPGPS